MEQSQRDRELMELLIDDAKQDYYEDHAEVSICQNCKTVWEDKLSTMTCPCLEEFNEKDNQ